MNNLKQSLIELDGAHCYYCVFQKEYPKTKGLQVHHCLIHRSKKYMKYLDHVMNCHLVCQDCHSSGFVNRHEWEVMFLHDRIDKFGKDAVMAFWLSLPEKLRLTNAWIGIELENYK